MEILRKTYLFLLLCIVLLACREHSTDFERRLAMADSLMIEQPDSAYHMLCAMNEEAEQLPAETIPSNFKIYTS